MQRNNDHDSGINASEGGLNTTGIVYSSPWKGSSDGHGGHEGRGNVANSERQHFLSGIDGFAISYRKKAKALHHLK